MFYWLSPIIDYYLSLIEFSPNCSCDTTMCVAEQNPPTQPHYDIRTSSIYFVIAQTFTRLFSNIYALSSIQIAYFSLLGMCVYTCARVVHIEHGALSLLRLSFVFIIRQKQNGTLHMYITLFASTKRVLIMVSPITHASLYIEDWTKIRAILVHVPQDEIFF